MEFHNAPLVLCVRYFGAEDIAKKSNAVRAEEDFIVACRLCVDAPCSCSRLESTRQTQQSEINLVDPAVLTTNAQRRNLFTEGSALLALMCGKHARPAPDFLSPVFQFS